MIINKAIEYGEFNNDLGEITKENIQDVYEKMIDDDAHWDATEEIRSTGIKTGTDSGRSRHFESYDVAIQYFDGSWVGWVYYYGGGKHAEPSDVPWMDKAKNLLCTEEEVTTIKRTFTEAF